MTQIIQLSNGMKALVDNDVYPWISPWKWYAVEGRNGSFYAQTQWPISLSPDGKTRFKTRELQRVILDPNDSRPRCEKVDHRNFDTLDCRRENLRWLSDEESNQHRRFSIVASTGLRGIHERFMGGVWKYRASIRSQGKSKVSSWTPFKEDAVRSYNEMARRYHGEFAHQHELPCRTN